MTALILTALLFCSFQAVDDGQYGPAAVRLLDLTGNGQLDKLHLGGVMPGSRVSVNSRPSIISMT